MLERFDLLAARDPTRVLLSTRDGRCTAGALAELAAGLASRLRSAEVHPGDIVGVAIANGPGFLAALLALRRQRAAALLLDAPATGEGPPAAVLDALGASHVLCGPAWPGAAEDLDCRRRRDAATLRVDPDIAVIKLTSGSTGQARGILCPSAALVADEAQLAASMQLREDETILAAIPMTHSYGLSSVALPALTRGAHLVVPRPGDPFGGLRLALEHEISFLPTSPAYVDALLRTEAAPELPASLRLVISAGAPLRPETARGFRERFGLPVQVFYGASECGGISFDRHGSAAERGTVGTPVEGVQLEWLDCEGPRHGNLAVRSAAVARGYHPRGTARLDGGRFITGDLARLDGGEVVLEGRVHDLINLRGRKVNPCEVEAVLRSHPAVEDAVVVRIDGGATGDEMRAIVAGPRYLLDAGTLRSWCRPRLALYKIPRRVWVVDRLPVNARGKLDRSALLRITADEDLELRSA